MLGQDKPGQGRPGQGRPGQARTSQARAGQARTGQARAGQGKTGSTFKKMAKHGRREIQGLGGDRAGSHVYDGKAAQCVGRWRAGGPGQNKVLTQNRAVNYQLNF